MPTILVVGAEPLYVDLLEQFPRQRCDLVCCETVGEVLGRAPAASLIISDPSTADDGGELTRRLKRSGSTRRIPLVVYGGSNGHRLSVADRVIDEGDWPSLLQSIRAYCPELSDENSDDEVERSEFDVESVTAVWRRPTEDDPTVVWPPPPPTLKPRQDVLDFVRTYAGYVNSLLEARDISELDENETDRLEQASIEVRANTDQVLSTTQTAINQALMAKDLRRMRELNSARTLLYEKLQVLRKADKARETTSTATFRPSRETPTASQKSEITRAAEARAAQLSKQERGAQATPKSRLPVSAGFVNRSGTAKRHRTVLSGRQVGLTLLAVLLAIGLIFWWRNRPQHTAGQAGDSGNQRPQLTQVYLEHAVGGITARPTATDPEGDPISYIIRWRINARLAKGAYSTRLRHDRYKPGDTVQVEMTPTDSYGPGRPMLSQPLKVGTLAAEAKKPAPPAKPTGQNRRLQN